MPPSHTSHKQSTSLKQSNKRHKSTLTSKRSATNSTSGKVNAIKTGEKFKNGSSGSASSNRKNRVNESKIRQSFKKSEIVNAKRLGQTLTSTVVLDKSARVMVVPPKVVGIICISEGRDDGGRLTEDAVRMHILNSSSSSSSTSQSSLPGLNIASFPQFKSSLHVLTPNDFVNANNTSAFGNKKYAADKASLDIDVTPQVLEMSRVCDTLLIVIDSIPTLTTTDTTVSSDDEYPLLTTSRSEYILTCLKSQGLPRSILGCIVKPVSKPGDSKGMKRRVDDFKRYATRYFKSEVGDGVKVVDVSDFVDSVSSHGGEESDGDVDMDMVSASKPKISASNNIASATSLIRTLCTLPSKPQLFTQSRPYLLSDTPSPSTLTSADSEQSAASTSTSVKYNLLTNELQVTGYLRGGPSSTLLDVNSLLHLNGAGSYKIKSINLLDSSARHNNKRGSSESAGMVAKVYNSVDKMFKDGVGGNMFANPDRLDGEQNLVGFDGDGDGYDLSEFDGMDSDNNESDGEDEGGKEKEAEGYDDGWYEGVEDEEGEYGQSKEERKEMNDQFNIKVKTDNDDDDNDDEDENNSDDDVMYSAEELATIKKNRQTASNEDDLFPDEVQLNDGELASARFARYRSLKSFRKTVWDPKENLPGEYSRIYHFSNFRGTERGVKAEVAGRGSEVREELKGLKENSVSGGDGENDDVMEFDGNDMDDEDEEIADANDDVEEEEEILAETQVPVNTRVMITLHAVPSTAYAKLLGKHLTLSSLLPHENKISLLNFNITQSSLLATCWDNGEPAPVKSKDRLTVQIGYRSFEARPVFSQHNLNSDKHKFERYLRPGAFMAMSCYGPVTYGPCPVMVWREARVGQKERQLIATGSVLGADADRIIVKRVVLTGYPTRVHKRTATIKYMFTSPSDILYFKPAALYTKMGLQGNIMESIGTHGSMKCLFNMNVKQSDTVCLFLYKRVFPKFVETGGGGEGKSVKSGGARSVKSGGSRSSGEGKMVVR